MKNMILWLAAVCLLSISVEAATIVNGASTSLKVGDPGTSLDLSAYNNDVPFLTSGGAGTSTNLSAYNNDVGFLVTGGVGSWTNVGAYFNDAGYLITGGVGASTNLSDYNNDSGFLITGGVGASTNLSAYNNDAGFLITGGVGSWTNVGAYFNDAGYLITGGIGASTNLSAYNNDAGFLITGGIGSWTNLSSYNNDAGYLITGGIGASTNLSDYNNDSGYLTAAPANNTTTTNFTGVPNFAGGFKIDGQLFDGSETNISISQITFDGHFIPDTSNAYDVASADFPLRNLYVAGIGDEGSEAMNFVAVSNLIFQNRGQLYMDGTQEQNVTTNYATITNMTTYLAKGMTATPANGVLRPLRVGDYDAEAAISFSGQASGEYEAAIFVDDVEQNQIEWQRKTSNNDIGSMSGTGLITITNVTSDVTVQVKSLVGNQDFDPNKVQLKLIRCL